MELCDSASEAIPLFEPKPWSSGSAQAALCVFSLSQIQSGLTFGIIVPLLPGYMSSLGADQATIGWIMVSVSIGAFCSLPFVGPLVDHYGYALIYFAGISNEGQKASFSTCTYMFS